MNKSARSARVFVTDKSNDCCMPLKRAEDLDRMTRLGQSPSPSLPPETETSLAAV